MKQTGILLVLGWISMIACAVPAQADPILDRIATALAPILEKLPSKAGVGSNEQTLLVSYQAQPYKVPDKTVTGEVPEKVHDEIGPGPKGFVLRVDLQPKGFMNQAATPQTLQEKFWKTDQGVTPVAGAQTQIFWALSYGTETDPKVLARIREVLKTLKN